MRKRVSAVIDRRILINYRVDPSVAQKLIPAPFRPVIVGGAAIAGICMIRLSKIRPGGVPRVAGLTSENAAHRFAVQLDSPSGPVPCVYVPRRDTNSLVPVMIGGRLFPGWHHLARFMTAVEGDRFGLYLRSQDGECQVQVSIQAADRVMQGSVFADPDEAAQLFRPAAVGYSLRPRTDFMDAVELSCEYWQLLPLSVQRTTSSYFDDPERFPPGSIELDSAFLMRNVDSTWSALPPLPPTRKPADSAGRAGP